MMNGRNDTNNNNRININNNDFLMNYTMNDVVIFENGVPPPVFQCPHCTRPIVNLHALVNHPAVHRRDQDHPRPTHPPPPPQQARAPFFGAHAAGQQPNRAQVLRPPPPPPPMFAPRSSAQRPMNAPPPKAGQAADAANPWWHFANQRVGQEPVAPVKEASPPSEASTADLLNGIMCAGSPGTTGSSEEGSGGGACEVPELDLDLRL